MLRNLVSLVIAALLLTGCQSDSPEGLRRSGTTLTKRMAAVLAEIDSRDACLERQDQLEGLYLEYAKLMVRAERVLAESSAELPSDDRSSELLRRELLRVYEIDGCREIVERAQREAVFYLNKSLA